MTLFTLVSLLMIFLLGMVAGSWLSVITTRGR